MKVLVLAPLVRIAMRLYLQCLLDDAKAAGADVKVIAPSHVDVKTDYPIIKIGGGSRLSVAWSQINPLTFLKIAWTMVRGQFDMLHVINGENRPLVVWAILWARLLGIRSLVTIHDPLPHPCAKLEVATYKIGLLSRRLAGELNIHDKAHIDIVSDESGRPVHIFPLPDMAKSFGRPEKLRKRQEVLFFGRMEPYKGIDNFVELGIRMRGEGRFTLAGKGNVPEALLKTMAEHPDIFTVKHRHVSDEEMIEMMDRAKVALLPYHSATQSGVPPVAVARGALPVGFAVGGLANQLPALGGIAVPPGDLDALETAVRTGLAMNETALRRLTERPDPFKAAIARLYAQPGPHHSRGTAPIIPVVIA